MTAPRNPAIDEALALIGKGVPLREAARRAKVAPSSVASRQNSLLLTRAKGLVFCPCCDSPVKPDRIDSTTLNAQGRKALTHD